MTSEAQQEGSCSSEKLKKTSLEPEVGDQTEVECINWSDEAELMLFTSLLTHLSTPLCFHLKLMVCWTFQDLPRPSDRKQGKPAAPAKASATSVTSQWACQELCCRKLWTFFISAEFPEASVRRRFLHKKRHVVEENFGRTQATHLNWRF